MTQAARASYIFIVAVLILAAATRLGTPLVTVLFSYFALRKLRMTRHKWLAVILFLLLVAVVLYGIGYLVRQAFVALPNIAAESIPPVVAYARDHGIELPFSDLDSLKTATLEVLKDQLGLVGNFSRSATRQLVFLIIAVVVAISLFLRGVAPQTPSDLSTNLLTVLVQEIKNRFRLFYESFERVMGAQLTISAINTVLTAIFVTVIGLKYIPLVIGLTFLCGLLPIVGNLMS